MILGPRQGYHFFGQSNWPRVYSAHCSIFGTNAYKSRSSLSTLIMSVGGTLRLAFDNQPQNQYSLCSWTPGDFHQDAVVRQCLRPQNIFLADLGLVGSRPRQTVIVKVAVGANGIDALKHEHSLYANQLAKLQGCYVPRCYGLFSGLVNNSPFGCLLLEYIEPHLDKALGPEEFQSVTIRFYSSSPDCYFFFLSFSQQLMVALCEIHKAGVEHGDLRDGHILRKGYSPCIVDFSAASIRHCSLVHEHVDGERKICKELYEVEHAFCFMTALPSKK